MLVGGVGTLQPGQHAAAWARPSLGLRRAVVASIAQGTTTHRQPQTLWLLNAMLRSTHVGSQQNKHCEMRTCLSVCALINLLY
jgi:hypothetical protein